MKGIVFNEFLDMVEAVHGFEVVDRVLERAELESGGAYTAVGTYDHKEMINLVVSLSQITGVSIDTLLEQYGSHLFNTLMIVYGDASPRFKNSFDLLSSVDSIIHTEVLKLYPDAQLPKFNVLKHNPDELVLLYVSERPFSALAKGLILGCAKHFNETLSVELEVVNDESPYRTVFRVVKV